MTGKFSCIEILYCKSSYGVSMVSFWWDSVSQETTAALFGVVVLY